MALTPKQQRFVEEYGVDFNATQAAIRAGYSERTARFIGAENLTKPNIQEAVRGRANALSDRTEITRDWIVREAMEIVEAARQDNSWAAVTGSLTLLAKIHGYVLGKRDVRVIRSIKDLSDAELAAIVARGDPDAAADEAGESVH